MPDFQIIQASETPYLYVDKTSSMDPQEISARMGEAFGAVWAFMQTRQIAPAGAALSVYYDYSPEQMTFRAGFAVARQDLDKAAGEVKADATPAGEVLYFQHKGSYSTLRDDYDSMMDHVAGLGRTVGVPVWEVYLNSPEQVPEAELLTDVYAVLR